MDLQIRRRSVRSDLPDRSAMRCIRAAARVLRARHRIAGQLNSSLDTLPAGGHARRRQRRRRSCCGASAEQGRILVIGDFRRRTARPSTAVMVRAFARVGFPAVDFLVRIASSSATGSRLRSLRLAVEREPTLIVTVETAFRVSQAWRPRGRAHCGVDHGSYLPGGASCRTPTVILNPV